MIKESTIGIVMILYSLFGGPSLSISRHEGKRTASCFRGAVVAMRSSVQILNRRVYPVIHFLALVVKEETEQASDSPKWSCNNKWNPDAVGESLLKCRDTCCDHWRSDSGYLR